MKRIHYIANIRFPSDKAHGIAVAKMCEAFAMAGVEVTLIVPRRQNHIKQNPFEYYRIPKVFKIARLPTIDAIRFFDKTGFILESLLFAASSFFYCLFKTPEIIYGRDEFSLSLISLFRNNVVWEAHTPKRGLMVKTLLKRCKKLVVISESLKKYYESMGIIGKKIVLAHSSIDIKQFRNASDNKKSLRKKLFLPLDKTIIAYIGKLKTMGEDKGVDELRKCFPKIKDNYTDTHLIVISEALPQDVPLYMKASDVLVMNYPNTKHYANYMSPLKLFEYMASNRPFVAPRLPSITDIINDEMAYLFTPGDQQDLIDKIIMAFSEPDNANRKALKALKEVEKYSWDKRAENIINNISI